MTSPLSSPLRVDFSRYKKNSLKGQEQLEWKSKLGFGFDFRKFAILFRFFAANGATSNFIFEHWIIVGAGASKFVAGENVTYVNQRKGYEKNAKNY